MTSDEILAALRAYHRDVYLSDRQCPECRQWIPEQKHLDECPWAWVVYTRKQAQEAV